MVEYKVFNLRNKDSILGFRCDRGSSLGNPYKLTRDTEENRAKVINLHNQYFRAILLGSSIEVDSSLLSSKYKPCDRYNYLSLLGKAFQTNGFSCWCNPQPCHCDTYLEFANSPRVCISGSRTIKDKDKIYSILDKYLVNLNTQATKRYIIGGDCSTGVDAVLREYAEANEYMYVPVAAKWNELGRSAGMQRNQVLVNLCNYFIAVWDGQSKGTENAIKLARNNESKGTIKRLAIEVLTNECK
jgi:hypothetical protein